MKRTFNFGKIDYLGIGKKTNLVTVDMAYDERIDGRKCFSCSADVWNNRGTDIICGGQCLDDISTRLHDPVFSEILRLWELYDLNNMHPECEHQRDLGWCNKEKEKVTLYHWKMTREAVKEQDAAKESAIKALQAGKPFFPSKEQSFMATIPYLLTTYTATLPEDVEKLYEPKISFYNGDKGNTEVKTLGWLTPEEHPDGLLSRPCPVCGYKYGTGWNYFPIPEEDEKIILKLLKDGIL